VVHVVCARTRGLAVAQGPSLDEADRPVGPTLATPTTTTQSGISLREAQRRRGRSSSGRQQERRFGDVAPGARPLCGASQRRHRSGGPDHCTGDHLRGCPTYTQCAWRHGCSRPHKRGRRSRIPPSVWAATALTTPPPPRRLSRSPGYQLDPGIDGTLSGTPNGPSAEQCPLDGVALRRSESCRVGSSDPAHDRDRVISSVQLSV
jgi:hypothetical protein